MQGAIRKYRSTALAAMILLLTLGVATSSKAQRTEEIIVKIDIPRLLQKDVFAHYDGQTIYVPLIDFFSLIEVQVDADFSGKKFSGQYLSENNEFEINLNKYEAKCFKRELIIDSTWYVLTDNELFLRIDLFDKLFDIKMFFNFSDLSIFIPLNDEFPIYQKLRRAMAHKKLREQQHAEISAQSIPRRKEYLSGGVLDWTVAASPIGGSGQYFNLGLGGILMGGDLELSATGSTDFGVRNDQIRYRWHYYFDNNRYITQVEAGKINTLGHLSRSLTGVMATNRPQIRRQHFQTITLSDNIGPGWEVELYMNGRLIDFTHSDENGQYSFFVDIDYGTTRLELHFFGPDGEIRTEERWVSVPFNLIPKNEIEYTVATGEADMYGVSNKYFQTTAYYGLLNRVTVGVGSDIPMQNAVEKPLASGEMTYQPFDNMLVNGIFSPSNSTQFSLNYSHPSLVSFFASYTKYYENEYLNRFDKERSLSLTISSPLKVFGIYLSPRLRLSLDKYPNHEQKIWNYGFKLRVAGVNLNYIGYTKNDDYYTRVDKQTVSKLLLSTSLIKFVRPQIGINYDHDHREYSKLGIYLNKRIFRSGQITFSYERNPIAGYNIYMATLNFYTDFAGFTSRFVRTADRNAITQTQKGSIRFDDNTGEFRFLRHNGIGAGSAVVWPFHDANYNGSRDEGEELLSELRAKITGGARIDRREDNLAYYDNLRAYDEYVVEIDPYSLDNPLLQPSHEYYKVTINPNTVTLINVPIVTAGEIAGRVDRVIPDGTIGVGGIKIKVLNEITNKEYEIVSFNNGEFFHLGLIPGLYRAYVDPQQLERYGYASDPPYIKFQIKTIEGGDYFGNANFILSPKNSKK